jgi:hypothetical protein
MDIEIIYFGADDKPRTVATTETAADREKLGQEVLPGAESLTPREMLQRAADAKPKPRPDQSPPPAGGLFDARGPAPLQTKLFEESE